MAQTFSVMKIFKMRVFEILGISISGNVRAPALPNHPRLAEGITGGEDFVTILQISLANVKLSKYELLTLSESVDTVLRGRGTKSGIFLY